MKRKLVALLLALGLLLPCFAPAALAAETYTIGNPYESVNWNTWDAYKTQLHVHTNASDGEVPLNEVVEEHYRLGYDILAVTDHMTLGVPWNQAPRTVPIARLVKYERTKMQPITPLTDARRQDIINGVGRNGRGMMEVTQGVELNGAVPSNSHLQGFFSDFGQGFIGMNLDYETPVKRAQKAGGVTVINHIGNTSGAEDGDENFYDENPEWVDKIGRLFVDYPESCLGMDISSGTDDGTKYDKILYDKILQKLVPNGFLPWSFTYSDAHSPGQFDRAFTIHMMPEKTVPALRKSMENGTFFSVSRHARMVKGDDWVGTGAPPAVSKINVNQAAAKITITASNYDRIVWISDGKEIAKGATLDIAANDSKIGSYVRAYVLGSGGILYVQPFTVFRAGETLEKQEVCKIFDYSVVLRWICNIFDFLAKPKYTPLWLIKWGMGTFDPYVDLPGVDWNAVLEVTQPILEALL